MEELAEETLETQETEVPVEEATVAESTEEVQEPEQQEDEKSFTQTELDSIIGKRLARERRHWERQQTAPEPLPEVPEGEIRKEDYENEDEFTQAKIQQGVAKALADRDQNAVIEKFAEREEEAIEKYPDYVEKVIKNESLPITEIMAEVIRTLEVGPEVALHLADNAKDAARIAKMPPLQQARELGVIEAKVSAEPPPKEKTKAPAPITPIRGKSGGEKKPGDMSDAEYRKWSRGNRSR